MEGSYRRGLSEDGGVDSEARMEGSCRRGFSEDGRIDSEAADLTVATQSSILNSHCRPLYHCIHGSAVTGGFAHFAGSTIRIEGFEWTTR